MFGLKSTLSVLKDIGCAPNKRLGQNFLIDPNMIKKSVQLAGIQAGDNVVEIGPGLGALTMGLLDAGAKVFAVEYDRALYSFLCKNFSQNGLFSLLNGDAVEFPVAGLPDDVFDYKIVSNLPYAISTAWLDGVLGRDFLPKIMVLMLQRETVSRFTSSPDCKNFGAISLFLNSAYSIECIHNVSRKCFYPEPKVDSSLLVLRKMEQPYIFFLKTKSLIRFLFNYRRKQIGSTLKICEAEDGPFLKKALQTSGIDYTSRPENVPIETWQKLDKELRQLL
ncbi:MAG: 16S rRNA (adenine(1518)-N(6)/adenine(1519)-N(6))-dimethyltransferase RsmA [Puniceicoccales bacterium]|jgi:16S rRNA (adenine1518-N6/adenine1519-N6)-dimethyltransferase|nr:16S rRNA (adenine(1518)-N(6)/adenine(1519)-N(6))-dimethyltransferase RsmA [Puniceicoccales bacterium]